MASSLFGQDPIPANPINPQSNIAGLIQQFDQFKRSMSGKDPQAMVQDLLKTGKMSKQQFDQLSMMATQLQGLLK